MKLRWLAVNLRICKVVILMSFSSQLVLVFQMLICSSRSKIKPPLKSRHIIRVSRFLSSRQDCAEVLCSFTIGVSTSFTPSRSQHTSLCCLDSSIMLCSNRVGSSKNALLLDDPTCTCWHF